MKMIFFVSYLMCCVANAQIDLFVDSVSVYNISTKLRFDEINEDVEKGPFMYISCVLHNSSDSTIELYPSKSTIRATFYHENFKRSIKVFPLPFIDNETIQLLPKQKAGFSFGVNPFLKDALDDSKQDYTEDIIKALPTLKITYSDQKSRTKSCMIKSVSIR